MTRRIAGAERKTAELSEVIIEVRDGPPDPAQLAAWKWLWRRLLGENPPEDSSASDPGKLEGSDAGTDALAPRTTGE